MKMKKKAKEEELIINQWNKKKQINFKDILWIYKGGHDGKLYPVLDKKISKKIEKAYQNKEPSIEYRFCNESYEFIFNYDIHANFQAKGRLQNSYLIRKDYKNILNANIISRQELLDLLLRNINTRYCADTINMIKNMGSKSYCFIFPFDGTKLKCNVLYTIDAGKNFTILDRENWNSNNLDCTIIDVVTWKNNKLNSVS